MKIRILKSFSEKLDKQIDFIAKDKPEAARRFKSLVLYRIEKIPGMPYANRKSIFFDRDEIRDMVVKGYIIVYKVDKEKNTIIVFGLSKYDDKPYL